MTEQPGLFSATVKGRDIQPGMKLRNCAQTYLAVTKVDHTTWPDGAPLIRVHANMHMIDGYKYGEMSSSQYKPDHDYELA